MGAQPAVVLVVTGAAATGKTTVGHHLRARSDFLVIDGDVLGSGAAAVAGGRRDYVGFWRYVLAICREVGANGVTPVVPCICLPDQVLAAVDEERVHFLALLSDPATVRRRIADRPDDAAPDPETHVAFDALLRDAHVPAPHTWTPYDVSGSDVAATLAAAEEWAVQVLGA